MQRTSGSTTEFRSRAHNRAESFRIEMGKLFGTAILITGNVEMAERAILETIDLLSGGAAAEGELTSDFLALACARSSVKVLQRAQPISDSGAESASTLFRNELGVVLKLAPDLRCCFVLRILMGYTAAQAGQLIDRSSREIEMLSQAAILKLTQLVSHGKLPPAGRANDVLHGATTGHSRKKTAKAVTT